MQAKKHTFLYVYTYAVPNFGTHTAGRRKYGKRYLGLPDTSQMPILG